jgi:hypothetical protein
MSQFPPPPPEEQAAAGVQGLTPASYAPAPYSSAAIAGFVCSLVFCLPVLHAVVGLIFSLVGIGATSGGQRRGRGLAIAGLLISILAGVGGVFGVSAVVKSGLSTLRMIETVQTVFDPSDPDFEQAASDLVAMRTQEFADAVSEEQLRAWLDDINAQYGSLVELHVERQRPEQSDNKAILVIPAKFVGATTEIRITCTFSWAQGLLVDNLQVGDSSARPGR